MKFLVLTDIHGSSKYLNLAIEKFNELKCEKMLLLGDILYHGPRNDLPENYNPKEVVEILNQYSDKIIAVRGNCDAEVDQMVLNFNLLEDAFLEESGVVYYLTHGHHTNAEEPADLKRGTVVLHGHTHIIKKDIVDEVEYLNIGSITLPKQGTPRCYAVLDKSGVQVFDLNDKVIDF